MRLLEWRDLYRIPLWAAAKIGISTLPIPFLFALSRVRGTVSSHISANRELVARSLERSFPGAARAAERRRIARRHFQFIKVNEVARLGPLLRGFSRSRAFRVDGLDHLDEALAVRKGAILLTAHVGYGRLIKPLLVSRGYSIRLIGRTARSPNAFPRYSRVGGFVRTSLLRLPGREDQDVADIEAGINLRPHLEALARNEAIVIPADGEHAASTYQVAVLGRTIGVTPGVISLARSSGAAVLPTLAVDAGERVGQGIRLEVGAPLAIATGGDAAEALRPFVEAFQQSLGAYPHLWRWSNRYLERHEKGFGIRVRPGGQVEPALRIEPR
jgi:lauroyl/myristoyl acyltransferase